MTPRQLSKRIRPCRYWNYRSPGGVLWDFNKLDLDVIKGPEMLWDVDCSGDRHDHSKFHRYAIHTRELDRAT